MSKQEEKIVAQVARVLDGESKWSVGDWVLYEHGIYQIKEISNGRVTRLTDGHIESSSLNFNDRIFELTLAGKNCADFFTYHDNELHHEHGKVIQNWPDLHRKICELFNNTMRAIEGGDNETIQNCYEEARGFFREVESKAAQVSVMYVCGIRLFTRS